MATSIHTLIRMIADLSAAISSWRDSQSLLLAAVASETSGGWLLSADDQCIHPRSAAGGLMLRHALGDLEEQVTGQHFRLLGAVALPSSCSGLVLAANAARQYLDEVSLPLRKLRLCDLDRRPEALDLNGHYSPLWAFLKPTGTIWRPVAAGCGVPRIQIRFAVRPLLAEGAAADLPRKAAFSFARQCISSRRELSTTREAVMAIYDDDNLRAEAARRDLQRLDALASLQPPAEIAYRYFAADSANINFAWSNGARHKATTSLPLFWCGPDIGITMPRARADEREVRADKKYVDQPVLETMPIYTTSAAARALPGLYPPASL